MDGVSEDCLTVNIFRPSDLVLALEDPVPVMLWIYGGGFLEGVSTVFNASEIIVQSVVRVCFPCIREAAAWTDRAI